MAEVIIGRLSPKERVLLRKEIHKKMIDDDLTYFDIAEMTGYSYRTVSNSLGSGGTISKFLAMSVIESLKIDFNEIRRKANGE